ncbi:hypothetical protein ATK30_3601 [Amycolatopsis echigonensis]|uniref:Copper-transporting ATPase n=1 Tax=Amycolatopsis echigonensis TaxID=2576905 RepID=A0A2N3WFX6_9PSEU|nr:DUF6541 family protein [Amycolatopsis niigatensis]PKV92772.1 hypothetical protein ATK30_3601 [Amycolatopsis niigatensis]
MPAPDTFWTYFGAVATYLAVLVVPGGIVGRAAGLRGWALAGLAPLLSYAVTGLGGPWLAAVGLPYNVLTAAVCTVLLAGVAWGVRRLCLVRGWINPGAEEPPVVWSTRAHWSVAACVVVATALSIAVVLSARGGTTAVFQRWDTVYHANGVRYIADTGDGSLIGMSKINWYPDGSFYPNGYHLVAALVYQISGTSIPVTLNAVTMPVAGIFALSMVAVVRQMGGRAVFAGCAALIASAATTGAYESVSSGLLPYALGVVLTPLMVVSLQRFLVRPGIDTGLVLALTVDGLLVAHSSALFGGTLFAAPLVLQRWYRSLRGLRVDGVPEGRGGLRVIGGDIVRTVPVMVVGLGLAALQILGAIGFTNGAYPYQPWNSDLPVMSALNMLATFQQVLHKPQLWLTVLLVVGVLSFRTLGRMRWLIVSAIGLSGMFVLVTSYGASPLVISLSRPWWNDRFRLMALAAIPLCLLAGHGMAELQRWIAQLIRSVSWAKARPKVVSRLGISAAAVVVAVTAVLTGGFYRTANATAVSFLYYNGPEGEVTPPVSPDEIAAMDFLGRMGIPADEKVLNDRLDGTAWMYALTGVHPVAGHYDGGGPISPDATYLALHFRDYDLDVRVREAVQRLKVHHVLVGSGSIARGAQIAPGLRNLMGSDFLRLVYRNPGAQIYTIIK